VFCFFRHNESYIGQIDLKDIRVICNRAVASPGVWSVNVDDGVIVNARTLDQNHHDGDCTVLNNQRVAVVKHCADSKPAAAADSGDNSCDAGMSDVLVENGRIVLQYRNVYAGASHADNTTARLQVGPNALDRTGPGHVATISGKSPVELERYNMNDVVWKNTAASSSNC